MGGETMAGGIRMTATVIRILLSVILAAAGVVHLVDPGVFLPAMPPYIPWHREVILVTGVLELMAAAGLWIGRVRVLTAWCLVAYFVAIIPAHLHIAVNGVAMFGISDPRLLWGRLALQAVFVAAAFRLTREDAR